MNEEIKKSKRFEEQIRSDAQLTERRDAFESFDGTEMRDKVIKLQAVAEQAEYEEAVAHGSHAEMHNTAYAAPERQMRVHKQVEAADAELSWSQKRKLAKRQRGNLAQAGEQGVKNATAFTVPLQLARAQGRLEAEAHVRALQPGELGELSARQPDETLFDQHYKKDGSIPYDVDKMYLRLAELKKVGEQYEHYRQAHPLGDAGGDLEYESRCEAQAKLEQSLSRAIDALMHANAVSVERGTQLTERELVGDRADLLQRCVAAYEQQAANFDELRETARRELIDKKVREQHVLDIAHDREETETLGFSFRQRPAELDELRSLIDAPENSVNVEKNASVIRNVLREYIRAQRTLEDRRSALQLTQNAGESFEKLRSDAGSDAFRLEGTVAAYADILRSLTTGAQLEAIPELLLEKQFGIVTQHRLNVEANAPDSAATEESKKLRAHELEVKRQKNETIFKYYQGLGPDVVNKNMDRRILLGLCKGWKTDADGNPATEADRETMQRETKWVSDLYGRDAAARHAVIDSVLDRIISMKLDKSMFTDDYIRGHYDELRELSMLGLFYDNLERGDPEYFQSFSAERRADLEAACARNLSFVPYLKNRMVAATGLEEDNHYASKISIAAYTEAAKLQEPLCEETLKNYETRRKELRFDFTTDDFSLAECRNFDELFTNMTPQHFADKLKARRAKGLPCEDMGQLFAFMQGKTLAAYYETQANPQYTREQIEQLKDNGFSGSSISIPGSDFGSDDLVTVSAVLKKVAAGGEGAREYGVDDATAAEVAVIYERFREECFENNSMKQIDSLVEDFNVPFRLAMKSMKPLSDQFPALYGQLANYQGKSETLTSELYHKVLESDQKLRSGAFLDLMKLFTEKGISFIPEHGPVLDAYMKDKTQDPPIREQLPLTLAGETLQLCGMEHKTDVGRQEGMKESDERIVIGFDVQAAVEKKRQQLGAAFPQWAGQFAQKVREANDVYYTINKLHSVAADFFMKSGQKERLMAQENDLRKKIADTKTPPAELDGLRADFEQAKQAEEAFDPKSGNPVYSKLEHKVHFMQYELIQKENAYQRDYAAKLEELKTLLG